MRGQSITKAIYFELLQMTVIQNIEKIIFTAFDIVFSFLVLKLDIQITSRIRP